MGNEKSSLPKSRSVGTPVGNKKSSSRGSVGSACENIQSEMSAGGTKRDVENTPKCTRFNCNLWPYDPPARPCRPLAGFGIVIHKLSVFLHSCFCGELIMIRNLHIVKYLATMQGISCQSTHRALKCLVPWLLNFYFLGLFPPETAFFLTIGMQCRKVIGTYVVDFFEGICTDAGVTGRTNSQPLMSFSLLMVSLCLPPTTIIVYSIVFSLGRFYRPISEKLQEIYGECLFANFHNQKIAFAISFAFSVP